MGREGVWAGNALGGGRFVNVEEQEGKADASLPASSCGPAASAVAAAAAAARGHRSADACRRRLASPRYRVRPLASPLDGR